MAFDFDDALGGLAALYRDGRLFIRIIPPFYVELVFDERDIELVTEIKSETDRQDFRRYAHVIEVTVGGVLFGLSYDELTRNLKRHEISIEDLESRVASLGEIVRRVSNALVDQRLKERYDLKRSSKAPWFSEIDWDIKRKIADASLEAINFPYSTLRINYQREFGDEPFAVVGGRVFDSVQVNFASDEVDYLIKILTEVLARLREDEERIRNGS